MELFSLKFLQQEILYFEPILHKALIDKTETPQAALVSVRGGTVLPALTIDLQY